MAALLGVACRSVRQARDQQLRRCLAVCPSAVRGKSLPVAADQGGADCALSHSRTQEDVTPLHRGSESPRQAIIAHSFPWQWKDSVLVSAQPRPAGPVDPLCCVHQSAFERPQIRWSHGGDRAANDGRTDVILLKGLVFHGYHGVLEEERRLGQKFVVDIEASADLSRAGATDDLQDTVNYAAVYRDVRDIVEGPSSQLLERVAQSIADVLFDKHPKISELKITLKKPHVAIEGMCEYLGVWIHRSRDLKP